MGLLANLFPTSPAAMLQNADHAEKAEARATIAAANEEIRQHIAGRVRLARDLEQARTLEERTREHLGLVGPAEERLRLAQEADAADRKRRALAGSPGHDPKLAAAIKKAQHEVEEAQAAEDAAEAALPALSAKVREAQDVIEFAAEQVDWAIWKRRMAELSLELPEVRAAASIVADFSRRIAALADVSLRHKLHGTPSGRIPDKFRDACAVPLRFTDTELQDYIRTERTYLKTLRTDPEAQPDV